MNIHGVLITQYSAVTSSPRVEMYLSLFCLYLFLSIAPGDECFGYLKGSVAILLTWTDWHFK